MKKRIILLLLVIVSLTSYSQKTPFTTNDVLNVKSFRAMDITGDGQYVAGTVMGRKDRLNIDHSRFGDPGYIAPYTRQILIIDTESGQSLNVFNEKKIVEGLKWSPDDKRLASIVYEDKKFSLYVYDVKKGKNKKIKLKTELSIASNTMIDWTPDGNNIILFFRSYGWFEKADSLYTEATEGPITVYDSERPFLKWDKIRNSSSLAIPALVDIKTGSVKKLLPESRYSSVTLEKQGDYMVFIEYKPIKTSYDRRGGTQYGLYRINLNNIAEVDTLEEPSEKRININWNESNTMYAYSDSGDIFIRSIYEKEGVKISSDTTEISDKDTIDADFSVMRWSPDEKKVLASSKTGYWLIDIENKVMQKVYDRPEDEDKAPNMRIIDWKPDGSALYMSYSARDKWERGLVLYDLGSQEFTDLIKDSNLYSSWTMAEDGSRFFYNYSDGDKPSNYYAIDNEFTNPVQLTDLNPWVENKKLTRSELVTYLDADGNELHGILYYPVDYEPGKKYPLVCEIYEDFFNNGYSYSMNLIANQGWFGFKPSVNLTQGYPGEAWIKGVTSGINKLIEMGLVDKDKLGVHGTSYGGYATSLLITQTNRFAAAINISGKTNIISFLGDSPRIGTRNYAAAEVGQDRIGASLWDAPLKYFSTTAVLYADRIETPHLLLTGDGDWNVPALNTRELYYAMRRLDKKVVWVNYINGGHGAGMASNESDFHDHWRRMIDWYSTYFEKEKSN